MRDHRGEMTSEEQAAAERFRKDITAEMNQHGPKISLTPNRAERRQW